MSLANKKNDHVKEISWDEVLKMDLKGRFLIEVCGDSFFFGPISSVYSDKKNVSFQREWVFSYSDCSTLKNNQVKVSRTEKPTRDISGEIIYWHIFGLSEFYIKKESPLDLEKVPAKKRVY